MNKTFRLLGVLLASTALAACGIFSDKDKKELEPKELVSFQETLKVKRVWTAKLGGEAKFQRVALQPVGDGSRIYAASADGVVSAYDPEQGRVAVAHQARY